MKHFPRYQKALYKLFYFFRLPQLVRFWNRSSVMILCYHGITERSDPDPGDRSEVGVARSLFLSQLEYLKRHYTVIALRDYLLARQNRQALPQHSVVLTFDDGQRNFLTVAAPILSELGFPATIYLVTDWVEARGPSDLSFNWTPDDDRVSLSWPEARKLNSILGFELGSHTCSHPEPSQLSSNADKELGDSLSAIRRNFETAFATSLAYPYGTHAESIAEKARSLGYSCALTTDAGSNSLDTDLFRLRRAVVRQFDTIEVFAARVSGLIGCLRMVRDAIRKLSFPLIQIWNSALSQ